MKKKKRNSKYARINELYMDVYTKGSGFDVLLTEIMPYFRSCAFGCPDPNDAISRMSVALHKSFERFNPQKGTPMCVISTFSRNAKIDSWRHSKGDRIVIDSELLESVEGTDTHKFCAPLDSESADRRSSLGNNVYFDDTGDGLEHEIDCVAQNFDELNDNQVFMIENGNLGNMIERKKQYLREELIKLPHVKEWADAHNITM